MAQWVPIEWLSATSIPGTEAAHSAVKEVALHTHRLSVIRHLVTGILLSCLWAASCGVRDGTINTEAEARFQELFGSTVTDRLVIVTDKRKYHHQDSIVYWVENKTNQALLFRDQSYEVQAFAYDTGAGGWIKVDLGFRVGGPTPRRIEPGGGGVLEYYALWVDTIDVVEDGMIRLVITGHTDLENPVLDRVYTAYTDVEVVQ